MQGQAKRTAADPMVSAGRGHPMQQASRTARQTPFTRAAALLLALGLLGTSQAGARPVLGRTAPGSPHYPLSGAADIGLRTGEYFPHCAFQSDGFGYFAFGGARVLKIDLQTFSQVGALALDWEDDEPISADVVDG